MTAEQLLDRCYAGVTPYVEAHATGSPGARQWRTGGVSAAIVPVTPERSVINAITFDRSRPDELAASLEPLESAYREAGVNAWGVWVVEGDEQAERALAEAGFKLDSAPRAMGAPLESIDMAGGDAIDVTERWDLSTLADLNERAYGLRAGEFAAALGGIERRPGMFCMIGEAGGDPVSTMVGYQLPSGDCSVYFVATPPEHQGKGFGLVTMSAGLSRARKQGSETTTLQSSPKGVRLYEKLGYRDLGAAVNLWEMRIG